MSSFAFIVIAVQACLLQNVCSQYIGAGIPAAIGATWGYDAGIAGPYGVGVGPIGYGPGIAEPYGLGIAGPIGLGLGTVGVGCAGPAYGGAGIGEVGVAGELGVGGTTAVIGQVPVLGAVEFGGIVPAGGGVSIGGSCACGCNGLAAPYLY